MDLHWDRGRLAPKIHQGWKLLKEKAAADLSVHSEARFYLTKAGAKRQSLLCGHFGDSEIHAEYWWSADGDHWNAMPDCTWADWDMRGRLLIATKQGDLVIHHIQKGELIKAWSKSVDKLKIPRQRSPQWARTW